MKILVYKKQVGENCEKPNFGTDFGRFAWNLDPQIFFGRFYIY